VTEKNQSGMCEKKCLSIIEVLKKNAAVSRVVLSFKNVAGMNVTEHIIPG
jgi:hypothetical protein